MIPKNDARAGKMKQCLFLDKMYSSDLKTINKIFLVKFKKEPRISR